MDMNTPADDQFGFYVASSDRDIISQVSDLLRRKGCLGFADTAGKMHYLVDGRQGTAFAARSILDTAGYVIRLDGEKRKLINPYLEQSVSQAMSSAGIVPHLKGYRYLRMMIVLSIREGIDPWPVSKALYPAAATYFHTTPKRIERDLRYCIRQSGPELRTQTNSMAINTLREQALRISEEMAETCETIAGETIAGETIAGETIAGETIAGETIAGDNFSGMPLLLVGETDRVGKG